MKKNFKRVLIVDDDPQIVEHLKSFLKRKGFIADFAYDGEEAIKLLDKSKPDLVILDVLMPRKDGFEVLRYLKSKSVYSKIPVIMLTAKSKKKDVEKGIFLGADFYLPKPFTLENLNEFIDLVIGKKEF